MKKSSAKLPKVRDRLYIVIPAFNEQDRIADVVFRALFHADEVIVVNDGSTDSTSSLARDAGAIVIDLSLNSGAGFATRIGCDHALEKGAGIIVTIDADGQHDPEDIPLALARMYKGDDLDMVFGVRPRNKDMPLKKRFGNSLLTSLANVLYGVRVSDSQTGFHVFTADGFRKSRWESHRYDFVSEIVFQVARNKVRYAEVPIRTIYIGKTSGMGVMDGIRSILMMFLWKLRGTST